MSEYHKIQSVYLRDPATKHKTFLIGQWSEPAFGYLCSSQWTWTEKIDGTNIRIMWDGFSIRYGGRTDDAQMPAFLVERLRNLFDKGLGECFPDLEPGTEVCLYGEGYGAKIQKGGGRYIPGGVDFILFDVKVGHVYLERPNVEDVAAKLGLRVVPIIGGGNLFDAIEFTRAGYKSPTAQDATYEAEGLVLRPNVELRDRMGRRIITKIKARDFQPVAVPA